MELKAIDRCDRCGAQAVARATKAGADSELLFCGHHLKAHTDALLESYWLIEHDESRTPPKRAVRV